MKQGDTDNTKMEDAIKTAENQLKNQNIISTKTIMHGEMN